MVAPPEDEHPRYVLDFLWAFALMLALADLYLLFFVHCYAVA
jgi:hypothetical protein